MEHQRRRCCAKTRKGSSCKRKPLANGRCPNHGGKSTGPRTYEGRQRIAEAQIDRWSRWRVENRRVLPDLSRKQELRLLRAYEEQAKAPVPEQRPQAVQYNSRLTRHALREAENGRGEELIAAHRPTWPSVSTIRQGWDRRRSR